MASTANSRTMAVVLVGILTFVSGFASAQSLGYRSGGVWGGDPRYGTAVQALPTPYSHGGSCVQMCVADTSPCDPDYYKVADRRCNVNLNGYFSK